MPLYIQTNISALDAQRNISATQNKLATTFQRLSSGYRINSAADDAAGLAISDQMTADIRSYAVAERNANNGISMAQTADGAMSQVAGILQRMRELAEQSANGDMNATDRNYLDVEYGQLKSEITRISQATTFNGTNLLSGAAATIDFQVGIQNTASDRLSVVFGGVDLTSLGLTTSNVAGATAASAQTALGEVDAAITALSTRRADFGAALNRMQVTVSNLQSMRTNLSAANSRIRDVDVAEESSMMAKEQVLAQAGNAILAQANQAPQMALSLLKG
jgi:flagellin